MLHGVLLITLFACAAFYIGDMGWVKALSLSPMVVGIILGMLYANSLRNNLPDTWVPGIAFLRKTCFALWYYSLWFSFDLSRRGGCGFPCNHCGCNYRMRNDSLGCFGR